MYLAARESDRQWSRFVGYCYGRVFGSRNLRTFATLSPRMQPCPGAAQRRSKIITMTRSTTLTLILITVGLAWAVGRSVLPARQAAARARVAVTPLPAEKGAPSPAANTKASSDYTNDLAAAVSRLDAAFAETWTTAGIKPTTTADDLTILRRLSLALHGTIPSLEEMRQFEREPAEGRLDRWVQAMLADRRFAESFAERMTRAFVGTSREPFLVFRRDRFKTWWAEQLAANRPYDEIVREVIADQGLWTGRPATNFITHSVEDGTPSPEKLAARTVRAVLGQRIDCAECHDHPFADWKQDDFRGLAAYFGQVKLSPFGVEDDPSRVFRADIGPMGQSRGVQAAVPFGEAWLPGEGTSRQQLASWCTDPRNRRFPRATVNRMWALLFGRPLSGGAPGHSDVDDLPDPPEATSEASRAPLDVLADEFVASNYDLHRLLRLMAASQPFQLSSAVASEAAPEIDEIETGATETDRLVDHWAVFPVERLRVDQVVGSMLQASSVRTIDLNSALLTRMIRFIRENDFLREYGDAGDEELLARTGTVPQALVRMNGKLVRETTDPNPFNATTRLGLSSMSDEELIDNCFLVCLSRRPTPAERSFFLSRWQDEQAATTDHANAAETATMDNADAPPQKPRRGPGMRAQDLCWTLINSPEFSWNH